jgi:hypothetical protein
MTGITLKKRLIYITTQYKSFNNVTYRNNTELSKYVELKGQWQRKVLLAISILLDDPCNYENIIISIPSRTF